MSKSLLQQFEEECYRLLPRVTAKRGGLRYETPEVRRPTMNIRISYTTPRSGMGVTRHVVTLPDDAKNIRCEVEIPVDRRPVKDDFPVVRVKFDGTAKEYCYRDGSTNEPEMLHAGGYAIVPPTGFNGKYSPQIVRVVGFGRNDYTGPINKTAMPIPEGLSA